MWHVLCDIHIVCPLRFLDILIDVCVRREARQDLEKDACTVDAGIETSTHGEQHVSEHRFGWVALVCNIKTVWPPSTRWDIISLCVDYDLVSIRALGQCESGIQVIHNHWQQLRTEAICHNFAGIINMMVILGLLWRPIKSKDYVWNRKHMI
jgi:hypothetical protein